MITALLALSALAYLTQFLILLRGLALADRVGKTNRTGVRVSVIVAARNEEQSILECLTSIVASDYPQGDLEILVINDRSTDRTGDIVEGFARDHPNVRLFSATERPGPVRGKANALAQGIPASTGELLLFTDADCRVHPNWVRTTVDRFGEDVTLVAGYTILGGGTAFEAIQAIDWIFLFSLAASAAGWNLPLTAVGNNLAVRRSAYEATGGYDMIPFSVTEDFALVHAVLQSTGGRLVFPADPDRVVYSDACPGWRELYRQKRRWGVGGINMIFRGHMLNVIAWLLGLFLLLGLISGAWLAVIGVLIVKSLVDLAFVARAMRRFRMAGLLRYFLLFEGYLLCYVFLLPFIVLFNRRVVWKGRRL